MFDVTEAKRLKMAAEAAQTQGRSLDADRYFAMYDKYIVDHEAYLIACAEECEAWREWDDVHLSDDPDADHSEANRASERLDDARVATDAARSEQ